MKRNSHLRGIVVAADTQEQATDQFRAVASGNYRVFESADGEYAVATANTQGLQILDPTNGQEMVAVPEDEKHEMVATASSEEDMDAFYVTCASGCGSHVIASEQDLLNQCPSCASTLPSLEDEHLNNEPQKEILLAVASSRKEVARAYSALAANEGERFITQCGDVMVVSNKPLNYDIYSGTAAADPVEDYEPEIAVASAQTEDGEKKKLDVHYLTTASDSEETLHILCSDQSPVFCPESANGLVDPENTFSDKERATASDDFDDYEDDEEEEDDDEEEEDDEDDEDEDDEEEEDDDDEEDDDLSLSLASEHNRKKGGAVPKKIRATASAQTPKNESVKIEASFVAYASSDMKDESVELAYAGTIKGEPTWIAFHDGVPFAKAVASSVENKAEFASANFGRAFKAIAAESGVKAAMAELKFEEIKPQINVDQLVATQIENQVQERAAELASATTRDANELAERFEAALGIASHGINTGFWKNLQNPTIKAIASSLEELGIQGGEELVRKAFSEHSRKYNADVIAKASAILRTDLEVQNQLAEAINEVQDKNVATAASLSVGRPVSSGSGVNFPNNAELSTASASAKATQEIPFNSKLKNLRFGR